MAKQDMGIGRLGFQNTVFKRKFRFTFELQEICSSGVSGGGGSIPPSYVKVAARPNLEIEETEINYLNAKTWIPGKASWQTMTVTYIDVATAEIAPLYNWLASIYNFTNPITLEMGSKRADYNAKGILKLYDGCGSELERWTLGDVWPQAVNFGELDYSSSEEATIELTLRYSNVLYQPICPQFPIKPCCSPCDSTTGARLNVQ